MVAKRKLAGQLIVGCSAVLLLTAVTGCTRKTESVQVKKMPPNAQFSGFLSNYDNLKQSAMFENTLALIAECGLTHLHVFPYSARQGTPAARMPQVPGGLIRERAARLRAVGAMLRRTWLAGQIGKTAAVLIERDGAGRSEHYARVHFANRNEPGTIVTARISGADDDSLTGEVLPP